MVTMLEVEAIGAVRVVTLSSGRVNALDVEFLGELTQTFRELERSGGDALVITGAGRVFSAGVDLNRVVEVLGVARVEDRRGAWRRWW